MLADKAGVGTVENRLSREKRTGQRPFLKFKLMKVQLSSRGFPVTKQLQLHKTSFKRPQGLTVFSQSVNGESFYDGQTDTEESCHETQPSN